LCPNSWIFWNYKPFLSDAPTFPVIGVLKILLSHFRTICFAGWEKLDAQLVKKLANLTLVKA
jgi:hypothetical protein